MSSSGFDSVTIFGSCVSRDTIEFADRSKLYLRRYIARQSLIASFSDIPAPPLDLSTLESTFQRRMVQSDLDRSFSEEINETAIDSSLLLWDLTDERFGIYQLASGAIVTRSQELFSSGNVDLLERSARFIPFGTDEHFYLWQKALGRFRTSLHKTGLIERTKLIAVPWAVKDDQGKELQAPQHSVPPREANRLFKRYYRSANESVPLVKLGMFSTPRASTKHKWGTAPFHYCDNTYRQLVGSLGLPPRSS